MNRVYAQEEKPISDINHAAIAIQSIDSTQRHIGVLHRESDSTEVNLLHLAWHHKLINLPPSMEYLWVDPKIPSQRMRQVAAICRKVWKSNQGDLPYALSPPNDCFDRQTGKFLFGDTRLGLTCASFVLAIFDAAGLCLAQYETWPASRSRPGDKEWQEEIVRQLKSSQSPDAAEHAEAVSNEIGATRYRPEEVAGAALTSPLPADFTSAAEQAADILERLR